MTDSANAASRSLTLERISAPDADDYVLAFALQKSRVRGRIVRLGDALDRVVRRHAYPEPVARYLAEAVCLAILLGTSLKLQGRFVLQSQTDGPLAMLIAEFTPPDAIRACARFDEQAIAAGAQSGCDAGAILGRGHLAMTIDQGENMQRYQGIVALEGTGLETAAHDYFAQSEQIPTRIRLGVAQLRRPVCGRSDGDRPAGVKESWRAGGLLVQHLPRAGGRQEASGAGIVRRTGDTHPVYDDGDAWDTAGALMNTIDDHELTDPEISAPQVLFRLFHEVGVEVFPPAPVREKCGCSARKIAAMLHRFEPDERHAMVKDGRIGVTCEFCGADYQIDPHTL